jgi:hypothetical protein
VPWVELVDLGAPEQRFLQIETRADTIVFAATFDGTVEIDGHSATATGDPSALIGALDPLGGATWLTAVVVDTELDTLSAWAQDLSLDDDSVAVVGRVQGDAEVRSTAAPASIVCPPEGDVDVAYTGCSFFADLDLATGEPLTARPFDEVTIWAHGVAQDEGGIVVSGNVDLGGGPSAGFLASLDSAGAPIWTQSLEGLVGTTDVEVDSRGDVVIAENRYEETVTLGSGPDAPVLPGSSGTDDVVLAEFDSIGTLLRYTQIVGGEGAQSSTRAKIFAHGMAIGVNDEVVVAGEGDPPVLFGSGPDQGVVDGTGAWLVTTPHLPFKANGSGDVTAALFTAHYVATGDASVALERTASSVFDLIETTYRSGERELQLVEAQEFYATPRMQFSARQVR